MKAFINCVGKQDSLGQDRISEIRGLVEFGGKPAIVHTLDNISKLNINDPILVYTNKEHYQTYKNVLKDYPVNIQSYNGLKEPLIVYYNAIKQLAGEHILLTADDNLFDFSLEGLVETFKQKDDNVLAARELSKIIEPPSAQSLNFGTCRISEDGKVKAASHSFDPSTSLDSKNVILDLYLIHEKRTQYFFELAKKKDLSFAAHNWFRDFYAWIPKEGFWVDIGKPALREIANNYFNK